MVLSNTFEGGMRQDLDVAAQQPNTYRRAVNMSIFHNKGGFDGSGASFAVTNSEGSQLAFSLPEGYYPVFATELDAQILVFSTNDTFSQIGIVRNSRNSFEYTILFDDRNDPNNDRFHFFYPNPNENYMSVVFSKENEYLERVYFSDGRNQDRVVNLRMLYQDFSIGGLVSDVPVHTPSASNPSVSTAPYPKYMSVHSMDNIMDLVFPDFTFLRRVDGGLKRGAYQYSFRYISSTGHASNWSVPTRHVLVTGTHFPENPSLLSNHHNREMGVTGGEALTLDGLKIEFTGLDTRWCGFEIAFIYSKTDLVTNEAMIVYRHSQGSSVPQSFIYDHISHSGIPFAIEELTRRNETIMSSVAIALHERTIYRFGANLAPDLSINLNGASVKPKYRYITIDETIEPTFQNVANPLTGRGDNDPLTNTPIENTSINMQRFSGVTKSHPIVNDYANYKGQQVEHLLAQYMGGETYGFAVVIIDRKGNPLFAQPISDFTVPENFSTDGSEECTLTKKIGNTWKARIKGVEIDGIKIPKKLVRDRYGRLNISGFMIVRTDRSGTVLHQGVLVPVVETKIGAGASVQENVQVKPYPLVTTDFEGIYRDGTSHYIKSTPDGDYLAIRDEVENDNFVDRMNAIAGYALYFSPDVMIEGQHEFNQVDSIKHVASYFRAYNSDVIKLEGSRGPSLDDTASHLYGKFYDGTLSRANGDPELYERFGRRKIGEASRLKFSKLITDYNTKIEAFDDDATEWEFKNGDINIGIPVSENRWKRGSGVGARYGLLMGMLDFEHVDIRFGDRKAGYRVANYIRPNARYLNSNDTGIDSRIYKSTGHYQPITESVLSQAIDDGENYVFNGIEVFGGDTYVNLFDFTRVVPAGSRTCSRDKNYFRLDGVRADYLNNDYEMYPEFATSMIIPIESRYNLALRFGRRFARNATYPQQSYCDDKNMQFSGGIMSFQPESFLINSVLLHQENVVFFGVKPPDFNIVSERYNSIYYGEDKILGERYDSFRSQKVNNYYDIDGGSGRIVGVAQAFSYLYVIFERGYGVLRARQVASAATDIGDIILGTGKDINGIDWVSRDIGAQFPKSIVSRKNFLCFVDSRNKMLIRHSQAGSRDLTRDQFMREYSEIFDVANDVITGYDFDKGNIYVTSLGIDGEEKTIIFNEKVGFMSNSDLTPYMYVSLASKILASDRANRNQFYLLNSGTRASLLSEGVRASSLTFIVNQQSATSKIFDNAILLCNEAAFNNLESITFESEYGTKVITKSSQRIIYDRGKMKFPIMERGDSVRHRGRYTLVTLRFNNNTGDQIVINGFQTMIRAER